MDRIKKLGKYQKAVLLALVAIIVVFTVIYAVTIPRVGYLYHKTKRSGCCYEKNRIRQNDDSFGRNHREAKRYFSLV